MLSLRFPVPLAVSILLALALAGCQSVAELRAINENLQAENARLADRLLQWSEAYRNQKTSYEIEIARHEKRVDELEREIARLREINEQQAVEFDLLKQEIAEQYGKRLESRAAEGIDLQERVNELEKQHAAFQTERDEAVKRLGEAEKELKQARARLAEFESRAAELDKDLKETRERLDAEKTARIQAETDLAEAEKSLEQARSELAQLRTARATLEAEKKALNEKIRATERTLTQREQIERGMDRQFRRLEYILRSGASERARLNEIESWLESASNILSKKDRVLPSEPPLEALYAQAHKALRSGIEQDAVSIHRDSRGVAVCITADHLFHDLTIVRDEARPLLEAVVQLANEYPDYNVLIEGHTDNIKIGRARFYDNLELSMRRAVNVYRVMVEELTTKVDPERFRAVGCGQYHPRHSNATAEGRRQNRRIEFIFTPYL